MVHLFGVLDLQAFLALQARVLDDLLARGNGSAALLIAELSEAISVGRQGSRADILCDDADLVSQRLTVDWLPRGGGCWAHAPGQLCLTPIVPLDAWGQTPGSFLRRLDDALAAAMVECRFSLVRRPGCFGLWGRSGPIAQLGVAVRDGFTQFGAVLNVGPLPVWTRQVVDPVERFAPGSLVAETGRMVRMPLVRQALVRQIPAALGCERVHVQSGHPLWRRARSADPVHGTRTG